MKGAGLTARFVWALLVVGCGGHALNPPADAGASRDADAAPNGDSSAADGGAADLPSASLTDGRCIENAYAEDAACACAPGTPDVCPDGCRDLHDDDENCGAFGHACAPGAACAAGVCGAVPVVVVPARAGACDGMDITVAGGQLFWADHAAGTIVRADATGLAPSTIVAAEDVPSSILVRGSTVYWLAGPPPVPNAVAAKLRAAPIAGGAATTIVELAGGLGGFTVSADGQTIYFSVGFSVEKVPSSALGMMPVVVAQDAGDGIPQGLALDGDYLAYANDHVQSVHLVDGVVARCGSFDAQGSSTAINCSYIGKQTEGPFVVVAEGGRAAWPAGASIRWNGLASPVASNRAIFGAPFSFGPIGAIALSRQTVFFSDLRVGDPKKAIIGKVSLEPDDAPTVHLARDQNAPQSLAVDDQRVYWSTADCAIVSAPR
jgi:hypothetical protein